ncbi:MAG: hypothetical protein GF353_17765 [Candidatus Lokiarchaeota archaeon]|nr:hypothetical protein [Candidatus Lokiarchaeota archaeon]
MIRELYRNNIWMYYLNSTISFHVVFQYNFEKRIKELPYTQLRAMKYWDLIPILEKIESPIQMLW